MSNQTVELIAANQTQKPVFANLIQLYLYDMAAQSVFPVNNQGRYEYSFLDRFWEYPYLILKNDEIVGFCMVISHCPIRERSPCWFMAEFFIMRPYRRSGTGRSALSLVLEKHPGDWEISWASDNQPANDFWPSVIPGTSNKKNVSFDGTDWVSAAFTI